MNELKESDEELNAGDFEDDFFGDEDFDFDDERSLADSDDERMALK